MIDLLDIVGLTAAAALLATVLVLPVGIAIAWLLARRRFPGRTLLETLATLPLVLPPVATGYLLLRLLDPRNPVGGLLERFDIAIVFTWKAVVLAMAIMSLPLVVRTVRAGFEGSLSRYEGLAATLGASGPRVFWRITLPLARRHVLAGAMLAFARSVGEFGATIVLAGSIPGRTQTVSVALYGAIETGRDAAAWALLAISAVLAFGAVLASNLLVRDARV